MLYGIEVSGRLFEFDKKEDLEERLEIVRAFFPEAVPVKIFACGHRKKLDEESYRCFGKFLATE